MTKEQDENQGHGDGPLVDDVTGGLSDVSLQGQLSALRGELEEARREAAQNLDSARRVQAELVNYRRRADEERISMGKYSNSRLIIKLLPVVQELDLAIDHAGESGPNATWLEGVKLIQRKLLNLLESEGIAAIETVGALFNPVEHEALGTVETTSYPPGHVAEALRPGYRLHDRIIQPAQVIVARGPAVGGQATATTKPKETEHG